MGTRHGDRPDCLYRLQRRSYLPSTTDQYRGIPTKFSTFSATFSLVGEIARAHPSTVPGFSLRVIPSAPIAKIPCALANYRPHWAAEALHGLRNALLIGRNDLAQVFRVHASESAVEPTRSENITVTCRRSAVFLGPVLERSAPILGAP